MIILFKTNNYPLSVIEIEATKDTESSYWVMKNGKESCERKVNSYSSVFKTKEEAINWMLQKRLAKIEKMERSINEIKKEVKKVKSL